MTREKSFGPRRSSWTKVDADEVTLGHCVDFDLEDSSLPEIRYTGHEKTFHVSASLSFVADRDQRTPDIFRWILYRRNGRTFNWLEESEQRVYVSSNEEPVVVSLQWSVALQEMSNVGVAARIDGGEDILATVQKLVLSVVES